MKNMEKVSEPMLHPIISAKTRSNSVIPHGKRPQNTTKVRRNTDGTLKNKYASIMQYK